MIRRRILAIIAVLVSVASISVIYYNWKGVRWPLFPTPDYSYYHSHNAGKGSVHEIFSEAWVMEIDKNNNLVLAQTVDGKVNIIFEVPSFFIADYSLSGIIPITFDCHRINETCDNLMPYLFFAGGNTAEIRYLDFTKVNSGDIRANIEKRINEESIPIKFNYNKIPILLNLSPYDESDTDEIERLNDGQEVRLSLIPNEPKRAYINGIKMVVLSIEYDGKL